MKNGQYKIGVESRLKAVEIKMENLHEITNTIVSNHLPHLDEKIGALDQKVDDKIEKIFDRFTKQDWFLISVMAGLLTSLIIQLMK